MNAIRGQKDVISDQDDVIGDHIGLPRNPIDQIAAGSAPTYSGIVPMNSGSAPGISASDASAGYTGA